MAEIRAGIVGTGFIATNLAASLSRHDQIDVAKVLTRRELNTVAGFPVGSLTNSAAELVSNSDVVVECSGDPIWATDVVSAAVDAGRPVVTMNTEFHITSGSSFVGAGIVTEAEGDQPGCLASLHDDAVAMGFTPVIYGNMKGFLNLDPTPDEMKHWGAKQGISLPMVTSFTDGTKVQAEQILVANHFGATIARDGMLAAAVSDLDGGVQSLVEAHETTGRPIADYVVSGGLPHGVFIVATHDADQAAALEYYKLGPGPYYTILRNNIFVHLEIAKTIKRVLDSGDILLDNSPNPELSLAAMTKRPISAGTEIPQAIGSFDFRGHAVRNADNSDHVPIGLLQDAVVTSDLEQGQIVTSQQVDLPDSLAVRLWKDRTKRQESTTS